MRIEFQERFLNLTPQEIEQRENAAMPFTKYDYSYRRIYIKVADIFAPKDMPGKKNHCLIEFYDQSSIIVKGKYDDICIQLDDLEALMEEDKYDFIPDDEVEDDKKGDSPN